MDIEQLNKHVVMRIHWDNYSLISVCMTTQMRKF